MLKKYDGVEFISVIKYKTSSPQIKNTPKKMFKHIHEYVHTQQKLAFKEGTCSV